MSWETPQKVLEEGASISYNDVAWKHFQKERCRTHIGSGLLPGAGDVQASRTVPGSCWCAAVIPGWNIRNVRRV